VGAIVNIEQMIRTLDRVEADLRGLEHRVQSVRAQLRQQIDPHKRRKDLGYWPDENESTLRAKV